MGSTKSLRCKDCENRTFYWTIPYLLVALVGVLEALIFNNYFAKNELD